MRVLLIALLAAISYAQTDLVQVGNTECSIDHIIVKNYDDCINSEHDDYCVYKYSRYRCISNVTRNGNMACGYCDPTPGCLRQNWEGTMEQVNTASDSADFLIACVCGVHMVTFVWFIYSMCFHTKGSEHDFDLHIRSIRYMEGKPDVIPGGGFWINYIYFLRNAVDIIKILVGDKAHYEPGWMTLVLVQLTFSWGIFIWGFLVDDCVTGTSFTLYCVFLISLPNILFRITTEYYEKKNVEKRGHVSEWGVECCKPSDNQDIVFWAINLPLRLQLLSLMFAAVFALCASQAFSLEPSIVDDHIGDLIWSSLIVPQAYALGTGTIVFILKWFVQVDSEQRSCGCSGCGNCLDDCACLEWLAPYFEETPIVLSEKKLKRMMTAPSGTIQGLEERKEYIINHCVIHDEDGNIDYEDSNKKKRALERRAARKKQREQMRAKKAALLDAYLNRETGSATEEADNNIMAVEIVTGETSAEQRARERREARDAAREEMRAKKAALINARKQQEAADENPEIELEEAGAEKLNDFQNDKI